MITDNNELHEYIISLITQYPNMTAYSILIRLMSYCNESGIDIPDMYQPENSEIALSEISDVINSLNT